MNISREEKKKEAIARMQKLGVYAPTIKQFKEDDLISISEPPFGAFYWVDDADKQAIEEFEAQYNSLVYMVIRAFTVDGRMDSYLYVSDHKEEWEYDRLSIDDNIVFTYTKNWDCDWCSEFGSIGFKRTPAAGLLRTA